MSDESIRPQGRAEDVLRLALPIMLLGLGILVWELVVRLKGAPIAAGIPDQQEAEK